jgi:putative addiction module component (TIGR02574 family)
VISQKEGSELPLREKLNLMEVLWAEIARDEEAFDVSEWHRELLDEREAKVKSGEAGFIPWDEAKTRLEQECN